MTDMDDGFSDYAAARWPSLYRTALLLTGKPAAADDLAQETLVKAYANWHRVRRADSPDAYVRKMLVNHFLGDRRREQRQRAKAHLTLVADRVDAVDTADRIDLWAHVTELPPRQRAVVVLRYYEDLSEAEIAATLGISTGTVKSTASHAIKALRTHYSTTDEEVS